MNVKKKKNFKQKKNQYIDDSHVKRFIVSFFLYVISFGSRNMKRL